MIRLTITKVFPLGLLIFYLFFNVPTGSNHSGLELASSSAGEVIGHTNQLHSAEGLGGYSEYRALMASAQAQNNYRTSIWSDRDTGVVGSRQVDRTAGGYGGGETIFVSENIRGGGGKTHLLAVERWQGDAPQIDTIFAENYINIGAGGTDSGGSEHITLLAGYVASGSASITGADVGQSTVVPTIQITPEVPVFIPIITATPSLDGSIIHTVQPGESVIVIAAAYNMGALELLTLNGLNMSSVLYPGDTLTIKKGSGPLPTATTIPPTRAPTSTSIIKVNEDGINVTPGPIKVRIASEMERSDEPNSPKDSTNTLVTPSNLLIALAAATLTGLFIFILSLRKK